MSICRQCKTEGCCIPCGDQDFPSPDARPSAEPMLARIGETDGLEITGLTWETPRCDHEWIALEDLRGVLAKHCLVIVPIAEIPSAEDKRVLEACAAMQLEEPDEDDEPGEPIEVGEDCYVYTDDQHEIAKAELARRAAKGET